MKHGKAPDPNEIHPIAGYDKEIYVKPTIQNPNITVGDFTYIADSEFESHVTNFYPWSRDKLIIGKFCQIATGVEFIMNDANHQMSAVSTFPFYTLDGWDMEAPSAADDELDANNWYEYVEYGTTNPLTILLQRNGFSRESARFIKENPEYVVKDGSTGKLKLKASLSKCGRTSVENEVEYIRQNVPGIFVGEEE